MSSLSPLTASRCTSGSATETGLRLRIISIQEGEALGVENMVGWHSEVEGDPSGVVAQSHGCVERKRA